MMCSFTRRQLGRYLSSSNECAANAATEPVVSVFLVGQLPPTPWPQTTRTPRPVLNGAVNGDIYSPGILDNEAGRSYPPGGLGECVRVANIRPAAYDLPRW